MPDPALRSAQATMIATTPSVARIAGTVCLTLLVGLAGVWGGLALWYRAPGSPAVRRAWVFLWSALSVWALMVAWRGHLAAGAGGFVAAFSLMLTWWMRLEPTNESVWSDDVARMTRGTIQGTQVTLENVRNFDWRSQTDYTQRWETRSYDLAALATVDMIMSYWRGPAIAHMLISFGFTDGSQVVFSVEIRRRKTQSFSEIGGFFKEFELSIVAADERDVVRLRTNVRGEDVYLYRMRLPAESMRLLFLGYVGEANRLVDSPRFYHTITVNCTTLVYQMMKRIVGHLPLDYRLLFSGYLPEYVYQVGGLDRARSLEELRALGRITDRARRSDRSPSFSADIRRGMP
jgi:Domain of unknown function (DUF4105)